MPGEMEKVAEYLGMPLEKFFGRHVLVEFHKRADTYIPSPAVAGQMDETVFSPGKARGSCVFLLEGRCMIHPVKPFECRNFHHTEWPRTTANRFYRVARRWKKEQSGIRLLLGKKTECSASAG